MIFGAGIPIVILSDVEDAEDVLMAFEIGAHGFLPTSLDPEIALQALLSFVLHSGSFFPSSTLHYLAHKTRMGVSSLAEPPPAIAASRAAEHEARGPLPASADTTVATVQSSLTKRQHHVLKLLCTGQSNKMIARELNMTEATVKVHIRHVMRKLGAANRTEAAILATKLDLGQTALEHCPQAEMDLTGLDIAAAGKTVTAGQLAPARAGVTWTNTFGIRFRRQIGSTSVTTTAASQLFTSKDSLEEPEPAARITTRTEDDE